MEILDVIQNKYKKKLIISDCKALKKRFNPNSERDLALAIELLILLYIFDGYAEALQFYECMSGITFNGNYTKWSKVVNAHMLVSRIYKEQGNIEKSRELVSEVLPTMQPKLYLNQRDCLDLYDRNIAFATEYNNKKDIIGWSLIKFQMMIRFAETPNFPIDKRKLNLDIEELRERLKEMIV